jgi:hypothetical protein
VLIATALWPITPELVTALDERLGPPVDSYVNGSQTWFTGEDEILEWRLHPVASYEAPTDLSHYDLWEKVVDALHAGTPADALPLGGTNRTLGSLWDGLECFPAYGDDLEPATLSRRATDALGLTPDLCGLVDHDSVGDAWERANGTVSIVSLLTTQLSS